MYFFFVCLSFLKKITFHDVIYAGGNVCYIIECDFFFRIDVACVGDVAMFVFFTIVVLHVGVA